MFASRFASVLRVVPTASRIAPMRFFSVKLTDDIETYKLKKKLLYRSKQRGFLELDVLVGGFAEDYIDTFNAAELKEWENILREENPEMFKWLIGMLPIPSEYESNTLFMRLVDYSRKPNPKRTIFKEE